MARISLIASLLFYPLHYSMSDSDLATKPNGMFYPLWNGASFTGSNKGDDGGFKVVGSFGGKSITFVSSNNGSFDFDTAFS